MKTKSHKEKAAVNTVPPYPVNPPEEDIYNKSTEETELDPEDTSKTKTPNEDDGDLNPTTRGLQKRKKAGKNNEKDFKDDVSGDDLDVPGSEFDEGEEKNGNEDEENDYYSLGGDAHNDLDEDRGE